MTKGLWLMNFHKYNQNRFKSKSMSTLPITNKYYLVMNLSQLYPWEFNLWRWLSDNMKGECHWKNNLLLIFLERRRCDMLNERPYGEAPVLARRQEGGVREEPKPELWRLWCWEIVRWDAPYWAGSKTQVWGFEVGKFVTWFASYESWMAMYV